MLEAVHLKNFLQVFCCNLKIELSNMALPLSPKLFDIYFGRCQLLDVAAKMDLLVILVSPTLNDLLDQPVCLRQQICRFFEQV